MIPRFTATYRNDIGSWSKVTFHAGTWERAVRTAHSKVDRNKWRLVKLKKG